MKLDEVLTLPKFKATFIERINRFVVRAELEGKLIQAYLPNPGKLLELLLPGEILILTLNRSQGRRQEEFKANKLPYLVLAVLKEGEPILLHTHLTNRIIADLIKQGKIPLYKGYEVLAFEPSFQGSRFDLFLEKDGERRLVEVKTCTLFNDKVAMFPDAVSQRGTRHLLSLAKAKEWGYVPQCLFVVMSRKPDYFLPAFHIDLAFAYAFLEVRNSVELQAIALSADERSRCWKEIKGVYRRVRRCIKTSTKN
jgi:sugar fermentation stimulation protein A